MAEDEDVEQAVLQIGFVEEGEGAAVKPTVSDEDERALDGRAALADDLEARRLFRGDLRGGEEIAERAEHLLDLPAVALDDLRIEADARTIWTK